MQSEDARKNSNHLSSLMSEKMVCQVVNICLLFRQVIWNEANLRKQLVLTFYILLSRMDFKRFRSFWFAFRIIIDIKGANSLEKPEGEPQFRKVILVCPWEIFSQA
jgi:hypothetical protein